MKRCFVAWLLLTASGAWAQGTLAPRRPETERLVSGAPLYNPNVAVHVYQKKQFSDRGRHELALYPVVPQLNGRFTQHGGTALGYTFHLQENFGLQLSPIYNWVAHDSSFNRELSNGVAQAGQAPSSLLLRYGGQLGVELAPVYGKFVLYEGLLARFQFVINAGAGVASTQHELKPNSASSGPTYGDTGYRFLGALGGGFRIQIADRFTLRLEARDLIYSARVDRVNGCNQADLTALVDQRGVDGNLRAVSVTKSCRVSAFEGTSARTGYERGNDLVNAKKLTDERASDVLNNFGLYAGFGVVF